VEKKIKKVTRIKSQSLW